LPSDKALDTKTEIEDTVKKLIEEKTYFLPIKESNKGNRKNMFLYLAGSVLLLAGFFVYMVDAKIIDLGITLPFDLVADSNVPVDSQYETKTASTVPVKPSASPSTGPSQAPIAAVTSYALAEAKTIFSYPAAWGAVSLSNVEGYATRDSIAPKKNATVAVKGTFDKNTNIEFYVTKSGVLGEKLATPLFYELGQLCDTTSGKKGFKTPVIKSTPVSSPSSSPSVSPSSTVSPSASPASSASPAASSSPTPATHTIDSIESYTCGSELPNDSIMLSDGKYWIKGGAKMITNVASVADMYVTNLKSPDYTVIRFVDKPSNNPAEMKTLMSTIVSN
jgi:hypothetical protein